VHGRPEDPQIETHRSIHLACLNGFPYNPVDSVYPVLLNGSQRKLDSIPMNLVQEAGNNMRKYFAMVGAFLTVIGMLCLFVRPAAAQDQQDQNKPVPYTMPEYNGFQACHAETNAQMRVKCLDDFVAKFPNSSLMPYVLQLYYTTYNELKNFPKTVDYADKLVALGDKVDAGTRLQALYARSLAFNYAFSDKAPDPDQLNKARAAALEGLKLLNGITKPTNPPMTDDQFAEQKKVPTILFNYTAGSASYTLKDYPSAIQYFKAALAVNPTDAITNYRLGLAYLQSTPPQPLDGAWYLARAIDLKIPDDAKVKDYLRKQILAYEQPGCDTQVDAQLAELLQLAANSPDRPSSYTIPSADDLKKIQTSSNILTVLTDLKAGGDKAKMTWLAICGAEFPEVAGKVIDVAPGTDFVELHIVTGATAEEIEASNTANLDVKVVGQPDAARLQKDDGVRFSGTLASYDPDPAFMLHWDKAKVNPEDIPAEKGKHTPHKAAPKAPGK
jgi:tetratricopeptide (TPR) repeat protein